MKMKKKILIMAVGIVLGSAQLQEKHTQNVYAYDVNECTVRSYANLEGYYQEKENSIHALILGDSNSLRAINPLTVWEKSGIVSYNLSSSSQTAWLAEYLLEDALQHQHPQLLLLDASLFFADTNGKLDRNCRTVNAIAPGKTRIAAMQHLLQETTYSDPTTRSKLSLKYVQDVAETYAVKSAHQQMSHTQTTHGFTMNASVHPYTGGDYMSNNTQVSSLIPENTKRIENMIQKAQNRGIKVLLIRVPGALEWSNSRSQLVDQFARQKGLPYFDMNLAPYASQIDWNTDTRDQGLHMNAVGAEKVSQMLANYLKQHQAALPSDDPEVIAQFQRDLGHYEEIKNEYLTKGIQKDFS